MSDNSEPNCSRRETLTRRPLMQSFVKGFTNRATRGICDRLLLSECLGTCSGQRSFHSVTFRPTVLGYFGKEIKHATSSFWQVGCTPLEVHGSIVLAQAGSFRVSPSQWRLLVPPVSTRPGRVSQCWSVAWHSPPYRFFARVEALCVQVAHKSP